MRVARWFRKMVERLDGHEAENTSTKLHETMRDLSRECGDDAAAEDWTARLEQRRARERSGKVRPRTAAAK